MSLTRSFWAACAALLIAGAGCQRSKDWNGTFHRSEGWWYSDGAVSTALPNGKTVWLFGDTLFRDGGRAVANSMAVQDAEPGRPPGKGEIRFFARAEQGDLLDVSQASARAGQAWVEAQQPSTAERRWLWPTAALTTGERLIASYVEMSCPTAGYEACRGYIGAMTVTGYTIVEVENPADAPDQWRTRTTPLRDRKGRSPADNRLHWGSALYEEGGWLYVFGTSFGPKWQLGDVKLARTVRDAVGQYDRWQFLTPSGWRMLPTGATVGELSTVARGGVTELSLVPVLKNGQPWLLMVQQDFLAQEVVVRSAPAGDLESMRWDGPEAGPRVRRFSLVALDPESAGESARSWSVRAHPHHSQPEKSLLVSFYSGKTAGLRFVEIPSSALFE